MRDGLRIGVGAQGEAVFADAGGHARVSLHGGEWFVEDEESSVRTKYLVGPLVTGELRQRVCVGLRFQLGTATVEAVSLGDASQTLQLSDPAELLHARADLDSRVPSAPPIPAPPIPKASGLTGAETIVDTESPVDDADDSGATCILDFGRVAGARSSTPSIPPADERQAEEAPAVSPVRDDEPAVETPPGSVASPEASAGQAVKAVADGEAALERARAELRPRLIVANEAIRDLVLIDSSSFVIGRKSRPDRVIDYALRHDGISGVHAKITFDGEGFHIEDLDSKNCTFLRGEKLTPGVPRPLPPESPVRFGIVDALFVVDPAPGDEPRLETAHESAVRLLLDSGSVTRSQESRARYEAGGDGQRVGEKLLLGGVLTVDQWCDVFKRAQVQTDRQLRRSAKKGVPPAVYVLVGLIAAVIVAIVALAVKLFS